MHKYAVTSNEKIRIIFSGEFEGDIVNVNKDEMDVLTRNAIKSQRKLWPNCKVPYVISSSYSSYERSVIASAMSEYHEKTCIKYAQLMAMVTWAKKKFKQICQYRAKSTYCGYMGYHKKIKK